MERLTNELQPLGPIGLALTVALLLWGCAPGAGRLRYDLADKGFFVEELRGFAPGSECAAAAPWLAQVGGVGCVTYGKAAVRDLEAGIAAGMPVIVRLEDSCLLARGRDPEQGLWVVQDERSPERVVSDAWLARRWTGWAGVGRAGDVTKE